MPNCVSRCLRSQITFSSWRRTCGALLLLGCLSLGSLLPANGIAQDPASTPTGSAASGQAESSGASTRGEKLEAGLEAARKSAGQVTEALGKSAGELGETLDQSETVQAASAGLLKPIYELSQYMAHPWFYWLAFALMVAGVVSFAGQVVLTKLLLLFRLHLNFKEILSDLLGLLISLVGLVLTTQAATQNSTFTSSPAAVLSSAVVGVILGFLFYLWGQGTEFNAARRARVAAVEPPRK